MQACLTSKWDQYHLFCSLRVVCFRLSTPNLYRLIYNLALNDVMLGRHWCYSSLLGKWNIIARINYYIQNPPKVSYPLLSHLSQDASCISRESLKRLVWHILSIRNETYITIVAMQFTGKLMGPSNIRYMYALMHWSFAWFIYLNKHWTFTVIIIRHWIFVWEHNCF